ncbi:SDR family oxidoreductase [Sphingobium sufflavum]|uniref:SDR family oxidoreductase n=1 Tax=Sphingobium sufflavum TaxID=1129547 RepID=UPI001F20C851|nr:SDR family oxidoreductase [Sphingobium sufflavum]
MRQTAVITGSTRGLGRGLAEELARRGYQVVVSAQGEEDSVRAAAEVSPDALGVPCDVSDADQVQRLWDRAVARFGAVDLWVNNAGLALTGQPLATLPPEDFRTMLSINLIGAMQGCQVALRGMTAQATGGRAGRIYTVLGAGADGQPVPGMTGYATTKRALQFLTHSLAQETAGGPVRIGAISPGLVMTEGFLREHRRMVAGPERAARERWVNVIGDHVSTIAHWACDIFASRHEQGAEFVWLSAEKIAARQRDEPGRDILSRYLRDEDGSPATGTQEGATA